MLSQVTVNGRLLPATRRLRPVTVLRPIVSAVVIQPVLDVLETQSNW